MRDTKLAKASHSLSALSALLALVALPGCHSKTANEIADQATRKLGVPVFVWAFADDECANRQMQSFYKEYKKLGHKATRSFGARLAKKYDGVILQTSSKLGNVDGALKRIQLFANTCYPAAYQEKSDVCTMIKVGEATISDTRATSIAGQLGTSVEAGKELTIRPSGAIDRTETLVYSTFDADTYELLTGNDQPLEALVAAKKVKLESKESGEGKTVCGQLASIKDL